jgi:hypothetical protein
VKVQPDGQNSQPDLRRVDTGGSWSLRRRSAQRAVTALAVACVAALALTSQAAIIKSALNPGGSSAATSSASCQNNSTPQCQASGDGSSQLVNGANTLSSDALEVLVPTVTLAGGIGGIMWSLGSQRGQGIVIGAVIAGVAAVMIRTIVA